MSEWMPIEDFKIPPFDKERWFMGGVRVLLARGSQIYIGHYSYTELGKGRWKDASGFVATPTHWMPLPEPPK